MSHPKIAFVFPGQGSQYVGMGLKMYEKYPEAQATFEEADQAVDIPLSNLCFEGPAEQLQRTEITQPTILATSLACERVARAHGIVPRWVAGHSLGEYSALVSANALPLAAALRLVQKRGQYMQEAVPEGKGAMAAIVGINASAVEQLCSEEAYGEVLSAANYNSPEQTVIAGTRAAVDRAIASAPGKGAKLANHLSVSAPFHCALMKPAQERLVPDLNNTAFGDLSYPLVSNVDARALESGGEARKHLVEQVTAPVRWEASVRELIRLGAKVLIEIGPKQVLSKLGRRISREVRYLNIEDPESLESTLRALNN